MRKPFVALASLILSLVLSLSFLGGCNLVTVDSERDMNQIVATVKIDASADADEIKKKDIVMSYINYGYMYEYNYGYSREKVINLILNQLITTRVYVQNAIIKFDADEEIYKGNIVDAQKGKWDMDRYLTEEELIDVEYLTVKDMNDLIKNYVESDGDKLSDTLIETVRTVPTNAANKEKKLSDAEKKAYINKDVQTGEIKGIDTDSTNERREAYNEVVELLEVNQLLGDSFNGKLENTIYYKETIEGYKENKLLEKFEKCITDNARAKIDYQDLQDKYLNNYETQSQMTSKEFGEKLSSATAEDPVLVSNAKGFGYVYNLLLGASEAQTKKINEIEETDIQERAKERKEILASTTVKDLRSTWLLSGYDAEEREVGGEKKFFFTGDYTFTSASNSLPFKGSVTHLNASEKDNEDYKAEYRVDAVDEFSLSSFVQMMEEYVYGKEQTGETVTDPSVYKKVKYTSGVEEYEEKINELLFAFSTDSGSLNTYKGYAISPVPEDGKETYMQEFADAGRELITLGGQSYIMVATDYGYHIMFFSQAFDSYDYDTLEKYLNFLTGKTLDEDGWKAELKAEVLDKWDDEENLDTDSFLYKLYSAVASTKVDDQLKKVQNKLLNDHVYSSNGGVTRYPKTYQDLLNA